MRPTGFPQRQPKLCSPCTIASCSSHPVDAQFLLFSTRAGTELDNGRAGLEGREPDGRSGLHQCRSRRRVLRLTTQFESVGLAATRIIPCPVERTGPTQWVSKAILGEGGEGWAFRVDSAVISRHWQAKQNENTAQNARRSVTNWQNYHLPWSSWLTPD